MPLVSGQSAFNDFNYYICMIKHKYVKKKIKKKKTP